MSGNTSTNDPIAWMAFDGRLVLHGKDRDPTIDWSPLCYHNDSYELLDLLTKENAQLRQMLATTIDRVREINPRLKIIHEVPRWITTAPPVDRPLIGIWYDDDDQEDYELAPCILTIQNNKAVWIDALEGHELETPPYAWILAPEFNPPLPNKVPF